MKIKAKVIAQPRTLIYLENFLIVNPKLIRTVASIMTYIIDTSIVDGFNATYFIKLFEIFNYLKSVFKKLVA